jgi:DtxR family Mn-dependent transcriptional regulator
MLRYFDTVGISLDSRLRVVARRDFAGMISVAIEDPMNLGRPAAERGAETTVDLGSPAAQAIWVIA